VTFSADSVDGCTAGFQPAGGGSIPPSALQFWVSTKSVAAFLDEHHYLGSVSRGFAWRDEWGVLVLAKPTARRLPQDGTWLELVRWCLVGVRNGGSRQWARVARRLKRENRAVTTIVSYSDPSQGHTGALYKAAGWHWAPTWHRLRPPPTGNGNWGGKEKQSVKDRWVYPIRRDARRAELLRVNDEALVKKLGDKLPRIP
jgi:hypothetical protein